MKKMLIICAVLLFTTGNMLAQQKAQVAYPFTDKSMPTALNTVKLSKSMSLSKQATVSSAVDVDAALAAGADRLVALQQNDGGWDWPLDDGDPNNPSPVNTVGPIAMGLAQAYLFTGDATHLSALSNAGSFLLNKTSFSPSDGYLANMLDQIFGGSTYTDHLNANFYGPLAAGTYLRKSTLHSTQSYIQVIHDDRSSIPNLAAWDIGMGLVGAASCGVTGAELDYWVNGVTNEINLLNGNDYYDVIGLAGAIYGLAFVGEDFDPTAGEHAAASNINDLADILASYQIDFGGFAWNSGYVIPNDYNETIQETAYSLLALYEVDMWNYALNINGAAEYMKSVQLVTGGWENYVGSLSGENNEITGEAMWGISRCVGSALYQAKTNVLDELDVYALIGTSDKKTNKNLKNAIKHINHSLKSGLWEDYDYLTKKGKKVFDEEKKAVKELNKIVKEKKHDLLKIEAQDAIAKLVAIDESLAQLMIDKAIDNSGDSKEIDKAEKEFDKAQKEIDKEHWDHVIDKYKKAWEHAYHALKKVGLGKYSTPTDELVVTTIPKEFSLGNNYPNPFNPTTLISYNLPEASQVTMTVYDLMGRKVKTLIQGFQPAGNHSVIWNATNDNGTRMSGGIYFYQIRAGSFQQTHKMILLK